jgi:hypothetical protein
VKVEITCDESTLEITRNLRDGPREMCLKDRSRFLWADAICINQEDVPERCHQVSNMLKIYRNATKVLENRKAEKASKIINHIAVTACQRLGISLSDLRNVDNLSDLVTSEVANLAFDNVGSLRPLRWFTGRPWFNRLWVFQEVNSGTEVLIMYGRTLLSWDAVAFTAMIFECFQHLFDQNVARDWNWVLPGYLRE